MTKSVMRMPIRVVFYKEAGRCVAHCLEFDLIGDGNDKEEALERLSQAIAIQVELSVEHDNPANLFHPADGKLFEMFAAGKDVMVANFDVRQQVDSVVIEGAACRERSCGSAYSGACCGSRPDARSN